MSAETTTKYFQGVGRRKSAVARVRLFTAAKPSLLVNEKDFAAYFPSKELQATATDSITKGKAAEKFKITVHVKGGGMVSQAEAIRLGVARALLIYDINLRGNLKQLGFLKRDARVKERKKFGLKKARKSGQWSKR